MSAVAGNYIVSAPLSVQYTFTGNDRSANFNAVNETLSLSCTSESTGSYALGGYNNIIKIKRAKLISAGAPGLQRNETDIAGRFHLQLFLKDADNNSVRLDSVMFKINNWNEWEDVNYILRPFKNYKPYKDFTPSSGWESQHRPVSFEILSYESKFALDDYNLQAGYVGQTFKPVVQLEIDTAGMIGASQYNIF